jgi:hypothetical protein
MWEKLCVQNASPALSSLKKITIPFCALLSSSYLTIWFICAISTRAIWLQALQSNLVNTTLVYTTPSILWHIFVQPIFLVQNSIFYTTSTLHNATFRNIRRSVILKRSLMLKFLHLCYVHLKYIHFHLGTTWELHLPLGT